jgi:hypothetical protein
VKISWKVSSRTFTYLATLQLIRSTNSSSAHPSPTMTTCGLYYKHVTMVNYASSSVNKLRASLNDDARVVIYDHHMFIVQATGRKVQDYYPGSHPLLYFRIHFLDLVINWCLHQKANLYLYVLQISRV